MSLVGMSLMAGNIGASRTVFNQYFAHRSSSNFFKKIFPQLDHSFCTSAVKPISSFNKSSGIWQQKKVRGKKSFPSSSLFRKGSIVSPDCHRTSSFHTSAVSAKALKTEVQTPVIRTESGNVLLSQDDRTIEIPLLWLRDHCRCPTCFNHNTSQKNVNASLMDLDLSDAKVQFDDSQNALVILWKDEHTSTFSLSELRQWFYPGSYSQHSKRFLWNSSSLSVQDVPSVSFEELVNSESGLRKTLSNLVTFGFSFVNETPVSLEATQTAAERVGTIMPTLYSKSLWQFSADAEDFKDSSYSNIALGAHTDLTYYNSGAGIQIFHCLHHDGTGGETLLVDGFHAANVLRERYSESFDILASCIVPHEYIEPKSDQSPGYHLYNLCPVLRTHPNSNELMQIRFNPYDRAPLNTLPPNQMHEFYTAYDRLSQIIQDPANELWTKLSPGQVVFIDNWRVMHGRAAFTGSRKISGLYLQRDEWISKARVFNLF